MIKFLFTLILISILSSCGTMEPVKIPVPETRYIYIPKELIHPCITPVPTVTIDDYMKLDYFERESSLTEYINTLIINTDTCNKRISGIESWISQQKRLHAKP